MRFLADSMLGRLARWLRFAGMDCAYERDRTDESFLARAVREGRVILTRDGDLAGKAGPQAFLVKADSFRAQLREVFKQFSLTPQESLTRCGDCNARLARVDLTEAYGRVPLHVYQTCTEYLICPDCDRIFWRGTHVDSIDRTIHEILSAPD